MSGNALECSRLCRSFGTGHGARLAVAGITAEVAEGASVAITGPSGSGKSTLLHLFAGLDSPSSGELRWPALAGDPRRDRALVGVVFQAPSLVPALDAVENVMLPLVLAGQSDRQARPSAVAALERLGLAALGNRLPEQMSGGQAERVALARVLAGRPALVLADEPTGQLDHRTAAAVLDVLFETVGELQATLIMTTHDPVVASRCASTWALRDGSLTARAEPGLVGGRR